MTDIKVAAGSGVSSSMEKAPGSVEIKRELKETAFDRILLFISTVAFCLVVLFVILQVVIRFVTVHVGFSLPWTEEAARYLLILLVFFGSAIAWRKNEHITITSLVDYLPVKVKLALDFISCLLILFFLGVAITGSYMFTLKMIASPTGAIPWLYVGHLYGVMTIGLALIAVYQVRWLIYYAAEIRRLFFGKGRMHS